MLQGFWSALGEENASTFGKLLTLCDEFSVKLDYSTPVSGGEWVVTVAHFGDRTEFRFPRLNFNVREANNILEQRLIKALKKQEAIKEAAKPLPEPVISEDPATAGESAPSLSGDAGQVTDSSESKDAPAAIEAEGKSESPDSTLAAAGLPSDAGIETESPKNTTSSAKDAPVDVTPKPEASSQSGPATDTKSAASKSDLNKTKRG